MQATNRYYIRLRASTAVGQVEAACRGRRTQGASFVVTYVLGVRCVVYVKGLGETYMTLDRRVLYLVLYLLLLVLRFLIKNGRFFILF